MGLQQRLGLDGKPRPINVKEEKKLSTGNVIRNTDVKQHLANHLTKISRETAGEKKEQGCTRMNYRPPPLVYHKPA